MYQKLHTILKYTAHSVVAITLIGAAAAMAAISDGSDEHPLRVVLVPTDGGTEDGTRKDLEPIAWSEPAPGFQLNCCRWNSVARAPDTLVNQVYYDSTSNEHGDSGFP